MLKSQGKHTPFSFAHTGMALPGRVRATLVAGSVAYEAPTPLMRGLRAAWRCCCAWLLHLLHGMAVMALRFPALDAGRRQQRIRWWSAKLVRMAGLQLQVSGTPRPGATLLVANHISWLDIAAIHAVAPQARFVSKADVLAWPLLGWLIKGAGTLVHRTRAQARCAARAAPGGRGAEGRRHGGGVPRRHHRRRARRCCPSMPTCCRPPSAPARRCSAWRCATATRTHRFSPAAQFLGETTLLQSVWRMLSAQGLCVHVELLQPQGARHADRRALAEYLRSQIHAQLHDSAPPQSAADPCRLT